MAGVNETKECVTAAMAIIKAARRAGSDGWQIRDATLVITDDALKNIVLKALEGSEKIVTELSKLDIFSTMDLATFVLTEFPKALGAK